MYLIWRGPKRGLCVLSGYGSEGSGYLKMMNIETNGGSDEISNELGW